MGDTNPESSLSLFSTLGRLGSWVFGSTPNLRGAPAPAPPPRGEPPSGLSWRRSCTLHQSSSPISLYPHLSHLERRPQQTVKRGNLSAQRQRPVQAAGGGPSWLWEVGTSERVGILQVLHPHGHHRYRIPVPAAVFPSRHGPVAGAPAGRLPGGSRRCVYLTKLRRDGPDAREEGRGHKGAWPSTGWSQGETKMLGPALPGAGL